MKIFFDPRQNVTENDSFSPSAEKPAKVVESWQKLGFPLEIESFNACTRDQIKLVHDAEYVDGVLECRTNNGFGNKSSAVANALPWVCGSMVAAALHAFKEKANTFSPTSGAHHARYDRGGIFCTFNFLMLAALMAHKAGAHSVGIIDCDMHYGDGTEHIMRRLGTTYVKHYSFASARISDKLSADKFIEDFPKSLREFRNCDLVLYNAGADPHIDDPLGGVMTTDQMQTRDFLLYLCMKEYDVPVATSLAGGYQRGEDGSIEAVLRLHDNTLRECHRVLTEY